MSIEEPTQFAKVIEFLYRRGYVDQDGFVKNREWMEIDAPVTQGGDDGNIIAELSMLANSFDYDVDAYVAYWKLPDYGFDTKRAFEGLMRNIRFWSHASEGSNQPERVNAKIFKFSGDYKFNNASFDWSNNDDEALEKDINIPEPKF